MTPATKLRRLHEAACLLRAYPQSPSDLAAARRVLSGFHRRPDVKQHAEALADSGIAGTPIHYRFFWPTARWLADRYPKLLTIDWTEGEFEGRLAAALPLLVTPAVAEALRRAELPAGGDRESACAARNRRDVPGEADRGAPRRRGCA